MRSHFSLSNGTAMACAVAGATTMLSGHCAAQTFLAADYATNSVYSGGWSAGQNGGHGFGAWTFDGTDASPAGQYQGMSTSSALGTAWTLMVQSSGSGLANAGRSIIGGLQVGQTFETIIQNPTNSAGIYTYRGFDVLFTSGTNNDIPGDNTAAARLTVFDYYNPSMNWDITDTGSQRTTVSAITTGASGMIIDLTLDSTNTYTLNMSPVSSPNSPYLTYSGTLIGTNLPINYVNFRLWNTVSTGLTDPADNFEISSMTIAGMNLNIQVVGRNAILSWTTNVPGFYLVSSPSLGAGAVWSTNSAVPVVINGEYVVTNAIVGSQQYYRLKQ